MTRNNRVLGIAHLTGSCLYFIAAIVYIYLMLKSIQVSMAEFLVSGILGTMMLILSIDHLCNFIELRFGDG